MHHTLLVEDNPNFDSLISLNLNIYVGTDVIIKRNLNEAIELLKQHEFIELIISRPKIDDVKVALEIYKFLQSENKNIPIIVLGEERLLEKYALFVSQEIDIKELVKASAQILGITPKAMVEKAVPDYFPIPIIYFFHMKKLICDVYIRVRKPEGFQYVKRFHNEE